jgi:hypothetical protein
LGRDQGGDITFFSPKVHSCWTEQTNWSSLVLLYSAVASPTLLGLRPRKRAFAFGRSLMMRARRSRRVTTVRNAAAWLSEGRSASRRTTLALPGRCTIRPTSTDRRVFQSLPTGLGATSRGIAGFRDHARLDHARLRMIVTTCRKIGSPAQADLVLSTRASARMPRAFCRRSLG